MHSIKVIKKLGNITNQTKFIKRPEGVKNDRNRPDDMAWWNMAKWYGLIDNLKR